MAQINMDGRQSFLPNDIKHHIRRGGNVTHILNVKVSRQGTTETGSRIRREISRRIQGTPITKDVNGVPVTITWRSNARTSSAYYHADVGGMFGDLAVKLHTRLLLTDILNQIDLPFNGIFTNGATGLAFMVSRPLMRQVVLGDESDNELGDEDELDEAEEAN
jgi:hypothetical protein